MEKHGYFADFSMDSANPCFLLHKRARKTSFRALAKEIADFCAKEAAGTAANSPIGAESEGRKERIADFCAKEAAGTAANSPIGAESEGRKERIADFCAKEAAGTAANSPIGAESEGRK